MRRRTRIPKMIFEMTLTGGLFHSRNVKRKRKRKKGCEYEALSIRIASKNIGESEWMDHGIVARKNDNSLCSFREKRRKGKCLASITTDPVLNLEKSGVDPCDEQTVDGQ